MTPPVRRSREIARGLWSTAGGGLLQFVPRHSLRGLPARAAERCFDVAEDVGLPVTFHVGGWPTAGDPTWPDAITMVEKANKNAGALVAHNSPHSCCRATDRADHRACNCPPTRLCSTRAIGKSRTCRWPRRVAEDAQARGPRPHPGRQARRRAIRSCMWPRPGTTSSRWATTLATSRTRRPASGARPARARGVKPMEEAYDRLPRR